MCEWFCTKECGQRYLKKGGVVWMGVGCVARRAGAIWEEGGRGGEGRGGGDDLIGGGGGREGYGNPPL